MIGKDGIFLRDLLESSGVNVDYVMIGDYPTGHAIIQIEKTSGENSILLYSGANTKIPTDRMLHILQKNAKEQLTVIAK